tara:strand:- start:62 stop:532 length:471 start_codon:yes stop_codon:yes gene_type:complete
MKLRNQVKENRTFWAGTSPMQDKYDTLWRLVPSEGEVILKNKQLQKAVEAYRNITRIYYDVYNNGGCNVAENRWKEWAIAPYYQPFIENVQEIVDRICPMDIVNVKKLILELASRDYMSNKNLERLEQLTNKIVRNAWDVFVETSINNQVLIKKVA